MTSPKNINFIVLSTQRTGSSWLIDLLNKVENAHVYGELFLPQKRQWEVGSTDYPRFIEATPLASAIRPFSVFAYLNQLYRRPGTVGFKCMYSQLKLFPELWPYFMWKRTRVVHLARRNHLDVVLSTELAKTQGLWHSVKEKQEDRRQEDRRQEDRRQENRRQKTRIAQVELNPGWLISQLQWLEQKNRAMQRFVCCSGLPCLEIAYEDLLHTPAAFSKLWNFLGIDTQGAIPQSTLAKIRQSSYRDTIKNYAEVEKALVDSEFAELLGVTAK